MTAHRGWKDPRLPRQAILGRRRSNPAKPPCTLHTGKQLQAGIDDAIGDKAQRAPVIHQRDEQLDEGAA